MTTTFGPEKSILQQLYKTIKINWVLLRRFGVKYFLCLSSCARIDYHDVVVTDGRQTQGLTIPQRG